MLRQKPPPSGGEGRLDMRGLMACRRLDELEMESVVGGGQGGGPEKLPAEALAHLKAEILCDLFSAPLLSTILCG